jgi:hypothetical protein
MARKKNDGNNNNNNSRRSKKQKFIPAKTTRTPPALCWEIILSNPQTAAHLAKWRWMWVLRQVNRLFNVTIQPAHWMHWQCENDALPVIWKKKADEVFALTAKDLTGVELTVSIGKGMLYWKETHLMWRKKVLALALAKHGGTLDGINAIFLKRKRARLVRRCRFEERRQAAKESRDKAKGSRYEAEESLYEESSDEGEF